VGYRHDLLLQPSSCMLRWGPSLFAGYVSRERVTSAVAAAAASSGLGEQLRLGILCADHLQILRDF
jgi:hypothetical protein